MPCLGERSNSSPLTSSDPGTIGGIGRFRSPPFLPVVINDFDLARGLLGGLGVLALTSSDTFVPGGRGSFVKVLPPMGGGFGASIFIDPPNLLLLLIAITVLDDTLVITCCC